VRLGSLAASFQVLSDTKIILTVPANALSGVISVTTPGGTAQSSNAFKLPPRITSFTPTQGQAPLTVTINGFNFDGATQVSLNNRPVTITSVTPTQIQFSLPADARSGLVRVRTSAGIAVSTSTFAVAPRIDSIVPKKGHDGTYVVIVGANFGGTTSVKFTGNVSATFTVQSPTQITAFVPPTALTGSVTVTTPVGVAVSSVVKVAPRLTSIPTTPGEPGDHIVITGENFDSSATVSINKINATIVLGSITPTSMTVVVPANATPGPIRVSTTAGTAISATNYPVRPRINSFTPTTADARVLITVLGANFLGATSVDVGSTSIPVFKIVSSSRITFMLPIGTGTGPIKITTPTGIVISANDLVVV
jgi:hypothetical protein